MATPVAIAADTVYRYGDGLFQYSGNLYTVCSPDGTFPRYVRVYKSTDRGATWSQMDAANVPSNAGAMQQSSCVYGSTIYTAYMDNSTGALCIAIFNMQTDTWTTAITGGPVVGGIICGFSIACRAAGSYVVSYLGLERVMGTSYERTMLVRYVSSAWQTPQSVSATGVQARYTPKGATNVDSSGRVHVFYYNNGATSLAWKTLKADNTLSNESTLSSSGTTIYLGASTVNGDEIVFPINETTTNGAVLRGTSGDALTLARTVVTGNAVGVENAAVTVSTGKVFYVYGASSLSALYVDNDGGTNTWGVDAQILTGVNPGANNLFLSAAPVTDGIGILYSSGGTRYYAVHALTSTSIKNFAGVPQASIKKLGGVPIASIKKVRGVPNV